MKMCGKQAQSRWQGCEMLRSGGCNGKSIHCCKVEDTKEITFDAGVTRPSKSHTRRGASPELIDDHQSSFTWITAMSNGEYESGMVLDAEAGLT